MVNRESDFSPFASVIAETTMKACMGGGRSGPN